MQLTRQQALAFAESEAWKDMTDEQVVGFQLYQKKLCMPFSRFHEALEKVLGRPVWTHEMADIRRLQEELEGKRAMPSMQEIIDQIPEEKRVVIGMDELREQEGGSDV